MSVIDFSEGSVIVALPIGENAPWATPYRAICTLCKTECQLTTASYENWQSHPAPHRALCVPCFKQHITGIAESDVTINPITEAQEDEIRQALALKRRTR